MRKNDENDNADDIMHDSVVSVNVTRSFQIDRLFWMTSFNWGASRACRSSPIQNIENAQQHLLLSVAWKNPLILSHSLCLAECLCCAWHNVKYWLHLIEMRCNRWWWMHSFKCEQRRRHHHRLIKSIKTTLRLLIIIKNWLSGSGFVLISKPQLIHDFNHCCRIACFQSIVIHIEDRN